MSEKRMLIVDAELVKKVDDNRGDMGRSEFINFLIESQLKEKEEGKRQSGSGRRAPFLTGPVHHGATETRRTARDLRELRCVIARPALSVPQW